MACVYLTVPAFQAAPSTIDMPGWARNEMDRVSVANRMSIIDKGVAWARVQAEIADEMASR